jgi:hypothetical protein
MLSGGPAHTRVRVYRVSVYSLIAAREVLGGELTPEVIARFVERDPAPLDRLIEARRDVIARHTAYPLPPIAPGELRPLVQNVGLYTLGDVERFLDKLWATLLYSHSAAMTDPLSKVVEIPLLCMRPDDPGYTDKIRERDEGHTERCRRYALVVLHALAATAPLIDAGTLVLAPTDVLPKVELNLGHYVDWIGGSLSVWLAEMAKEDGELHPEVPAKRYKSDLELLASTGWSVHIPPFESSSLTERMALRSLLRRARLRLWRHNLRSVTLGRFDHFAIDTLTEIPVTDLSRLTNHEIQLVRDEDAFGAWRVELTGVLAEYERNLGAAVPEAARIATQRLARRATDIDRVVEESSALSALRAGVSIFGVAGSAVLAAFPVLSVAGRLDGLSLAAGSSLVETGRRLVFHERTRREVAVTSALGEHYRGAAVIFDAKTDRVARPFSHPAGLRATPFAPA